MQWQRIKTRKNISVWWARRPENSFLGVINEPPRLGAFIPAGYLYGDAEVIRRSFRNWWLRTGIRLLRISHTHIGPFRSAGKSHHRTLVFGPFWGSSDEIETEPCSGSYFRGMFRNRGIDQKSIPFELTENTETCSVWKGLYFGTPLYRLPGQGSKLGRRGVPSPSP